MRLFVLFAFTLASGTVHGLIYRHDAAKLMAELTRSARAVEQHALPTP